MNLQFKEVNESVKKGALISFSMRVKRQLHTFSTLTQFLNEAKTAAFSMTEWPEKTGRWMRKGLRMKRRISKFPYFPRSALK